MATRDVHAACLEIDNPANRPHIVCVEPWGGDYTILPGQRLEVIARDHQEMPSFKVIEAEERTQVWIKARNEDYIVLQDGKRIESGHQRKAGQAAGLDY